DFGLARDLNARSLTATGVAVGTAGYMAPEQLDAKTAGPPCDVFALGAVLHELVTGARAFAGQAPHEAAMRALRAERAPATKTAGVPAGLERIIERALRPASSERPGAAELAAALDDLIATGGVEPTRAPRWLGAALLVVALAAASAALAWPHGAPPATPPPVAPPPSEPWRDAERRLRGGAALAASDLEALAAAPSADSLLEAALLAPLAEDLDASALVARHRSSRPLALLAARELLAARDTEAALRALEGAPS